jgi:hypothetical protein
MECPPQGEIMKMTKKSFFVGIPVMVMVFGLLIAGCDTGTNSDSNPFVGTWIYDGSIMMPLIMTDSTWETPPDDKDKYQPQKGTYTRSGNTATLILTHSWDSDKEIWEEEEVKPSFTATVSGNKLAINEGYKTSTYTRQ